MLAKELYKNTNKNYILKVLYLLNNYNNMEIDWNLFFENFTLKDLRSREFQLSKDQNSYRNKERCLSLLNIVNQYKKKELENFFNIILKKCSNKYLKLFLSKEYHLIDCNINLELFKKIIFYLNDKMIKKIMDNNLNNDQVEYLVNYRGLSLVYLSSKEKTNIKSFYFYIMNGGRISQKGLISFLKKIHSRVYGFSVKGFYSKKILTRFFKQVLNSDYLDSLISKKNPELERKIDASLVLFFDVKNPDKNILKFKELYNTRHKILINKIFHDIYSFEEEDQIIKKENYTFKKYFKHKPLIKMVYEKTIDEYFVYPYFYRTLLSLKRIIPELDEQWFYSLENYTIEELKFIYEYEEGFSNLSSFLINKGYSKRKIFNIITRNINEEKRNKVDNGYLNDIVSMFNTLGTMSWEGSLRKKHKDVILIHDFLTVEIRKQSQENYYLNQVEIEFLDGKEFEEEIFLSVPLTNYDLIEVGALLNHCVGNGTYSSKVLNKESNILTFKDKDEILLACVEIYKGKVIQSKGYSNSNYKFDHAKLFKLIDDLKN